MYGVWRKRGEGEPQVVVRSCTTQAGADVYYSRVGKGVGSGSKCEATTINILTGVNKMSDIKQTKYAFWVELTDGQEIRWGGLTLRQVQNMHSVTDKRLPLNVKAYGWEEQK
jgi:hypothetical protein